MENNNQYDELLVRYLFNEETREEKVFIENWLKASEENQRYFNRLKKVWQLTDIKQDLVYITDEANLQEKWNRFKQIIAEKEVETIQINEPGTSGREYLEKEMPARKSAVYRLLISTAIAASVLLVVGVAWKLFFNNNKQETSIARNTEKRTDKVAFEIRHEVNTTAKEKRIQLPDGSLIVMATKSEVTYREPFTDQRNITLIGKGFFKVAKDKAKPFTVFSGDISTTALGTEFTVTTFKKNNQVIIRLYEGKVVVKAVNKSNRKLKNDVYLLPGQSFLYDNRSIARVNQLKINSTTGPEQIMKQELNLDNPLLPENSKSPYFMFNNQPLDEVLDDLAALYDVKIIYDKKDVQNLYLIGKYNSTDSIEMILRRIATRNNLTVYKKDNAFVVSK